MINLSNRKSSLFRFLTLIGLILLLIFPFRSWVLAQSGVRYFTSANVIYTSEFGIENPEGMAYSPDNDSFIIWAKNKGNHATLLHNESSKKITLPSYVENPVGTAFDQYSDNLFTLSAGNTELIRTAIEEGNLPATGFNVKSFDLQDIQGMTFDPDTGRLFILGASRPQLLTLSPHPVNGFNEVTNSNNRFSSLSLGTISEARLRGVAFNPENGHLYIGSPDERKVYELTETGEKLSTYDIGDLNLANPSVMLFAPSQDTTDDPNRMALYLLDNGQPAKTDSTSLVDLRSTAQKGQIVELSLQAPTALPPATTLLPSTLVRTFNTSNTAWNPSSPDPAGIDYWPARQRLLISDSEVDEMSIYFQGKNVFLSTTSGTLTGTCSTTSFTGEPSGRAINPNNNHIFFSTDFNDTIFEVSLGSDGTYCTSDDTVTATNVSSLYNINDAEDVAYGNNTLFIGGGDSAEVYRIPLGQNGVLGGGDDGTMTHFDTASLGFGDVEAIGYNTDSNTLFIASPRATERYLGEVSTSGMLLRAYDLSLMGTDGNLRSDVTYAPSSQNPAIKNIYIASRGVDNDVNRKENDGKVWEINIGSVITPTATPVTPGSANVQVKIGGNTAGNYQIPLHGSERASFPGVDDGPVKISNTNNLNILAAMRVIWKEPGIRASYSEMMGLPVEQLSNEYWFPWYNNVNTTSMDQGFRIANVDTASPNTVEIWVGSTKLDTVNLAAGESVRIGYHVNNGPIRILCTTCTNTGSDKIIAALRVIWREPGQRYSYSEMMGLPKERLSNEYWFPWYNNATPSMDQGFRIANVSIAESNTVEVWVGGTKLDTFTLAAGASTRVGYHVDNGPARIVCTTCANAASDKIITALRVIWQEPGFRASYSEMMGLPREQLSEEYWFPWYNNATPSMDQGFRIANVDTSGHTIQVWVGTTQLDSFSLGAGASTRKGYTVDNGPIKILCTDCSSSDKIIAAMRVIWQEPGYRSSYSEMMGLPVEQLSNEYWFPWYNFAAPNSMDQGFRIAVP